MKYIVTRITVQLLLIVVPIIVPSSHTGINRGLGKKRNMYICILSNITNCHARVSHKHRIHGKLTSRIRWVSLKGIQRLQLHTSNNFFSVITRVSDALWGSQLVLALYHC